MSFVYTLRVTNDDGDKSIVVGHVATKQEADRIVKQADRIGVDCGLMWEGPVLARDYPIGKIINEEGEDE